MIELYLDDLLAFFEKGGFVLYLVFAIALFLWAFLIERYVYINITFKKEKQALLDDVKNIDPKNKFKDEIKRYLLENCSIKLSSGISFINTLIIVCPLVGLLGTVMGMIETFDALQSSSMFAQGNSISGGISKALFTTELGLVVAVPGLILGRILDKKEDRFALELEQITDIICTKDK